MEILLYFRRQPITVGATKFLTQIFWVLVTDRAEILRDRLEERQDPSF